MNTSWTSRKKLIYVIPSAWKRVMIGNLKNSAAIEDVQSNDTITKHQILTLSNSLKQLRGLTMIKCQSS